MNKFKYFFILLIAVTALVSCNKNDDDDKVETVPLRDYQEQYLKDNDSIIKYLKTNYIEEVTANFDIKITKIPKNGTQISIFDQTVYPLQSRDVYSDGITYKVYYLKLNEGVGEAPCNFDKVSVAYTGSLLDGTVFDNSYNLARDFDLNIYLARPVIDGWAEIMPKFKSGTSKAGDDGVLTYSDFGAGVMFLPSGLAYYAGGTTGIAAYTPIMFSFKLYQIQRADHDADGILDINEDLNGDGYIYDFRDTVRYPNPPASLIDDTDGDGIANFMDIDDDGDGYTTLLEITKPAAEVGGTFGSSKYYPFEAFVVVDDPTTPNTNEALNSESKGIPAFLSVGADATGKPINIYDYTTAGRLKIHLDKNHNTTKVTTTTAKR